MKIGKLILYCKGRLSDLSLERQAATRNALRLAIERRADLWLQPVDID